MRQRFKNKGRKQYYVLTFDRRATEAEIMNKSSSTSGFYKLNPRERLQLVKEFAGRSDEERALLLNTGSLPLDLADRLIENVIGCSGYQHAFTKTRMLRKLSDSYTALHKH